MPVGIEETFQIERVLAWIKIARAAIRMAPLAFDSVIVDPITAPLNQFVHTPT